MSLKLSPLDIHLRTSPRSGWTVERPRLGRAELDALAALIEPPLDAAARQKFELFVQRIFAFAVDGLVTQQRYGGHPVVTIRDRLGRFLREMEHAQTTIHKLDVGVRRLIDDELAEFARAGTARVHSPHASIEAWGSARSELISVIIMASRRLEIAVVKGESGAVYRQMVRGLLALVHELTGELPKRSTSRRGGGESSVEDYWFLRLSQRLADHVFAAAAPMAPQAERPARGGAERARGTSPGAPRSPRLKREPKQVGPPPLSMIVRQELAALRAEI